MQLSLMLHGNKETQQITERQAGTQWMAGVCLGREGAAVGGRQKMGKEMGGGGVGGKGRGARGVWFIFRPSFRDKTITSIVKVGR